MRSIFLIITILGSSVCFSQMLTPYSETYRKVTKPKNGKGLAPDSTKVNGNEEPGEKEELNNERVIFYGLTSLNSSNEDLVDNITASGRLAVLFLPFENGKLQINMGANLLNANPKKGIERDSVDFNSLMFPETGNFGFLFNPALRLYKSGEHSLFLDATYSYRKVAIDSPDISFKVNSVNIGAKYVWNYKKDDVDKHFIFTLMPYWNAFNVPDEDVTRFNSVINDPLFIKENTGAEIYSFGLKTSVQYKSFIFFADLRKNYNTKNLHDDNPFKGTKFNIGFATSVKLKGF